MGPHITLGYICVVVKNYQCGKAHITQWGIHNKSFEG